MSDTLASILYSVSFLFSLLLIGGLWWVTLRFRGGRALWLPLAIGWTLNTASSVAWGLYEVFGSEDIPGIIDALYIVRYAFVWWALWRYPAPWPLARRALEMLGVMLATAALLGVAVIPWLNARSSDSLAFIWSATIYPLLDAATVYLAGARWRATRAEATGPVLGLLALSAAAYGLANAINFVARRLAPGADTLSVMLLWFLTDVCVAAAIWRFVRIITNERKF